MLYFSEPSKKVIKMDKLQLLQVAKKMLLLGGGKENKEKVERKHSHHKTKTMRTVSSFRA